MLTNMIINSNQCEYDKEYYLITASKLELKISDLDLLQKVRIYSLKTGNEILFQRMEPDLPVFQMECKEERKKYKDLKLVIT